MSILNSPSHLIRKLKLVFYLPLPTKIYLHPVLHNPFLSAYMFPLFPVMLVVVDLINESNNMLQLSLGFTWSMSHDMNSL